MRALPGCILVLSLTGCTWLHTPHPSATSNTPPAAVDNAPVVHKAQRPLPAKLYKNAEDLVGKPFRNLGEVYGSTCQVNLQDPPPNLAEARKEMLMRAAYMKANGVLLHQCEMVRHVAGCYQQAVCQGTALKVSQ